MDLGNRVAEIVNFKVFAQRMLLVHTGQMDLNTSVHSQLEFIPMYEEKIGQIKEEFQSTVAGIQSAMMMAIRNYDKKCNESESLLVQLNEEKAKAQRLEKQVEHFRNAINEKDALILKLQQCKTACKHTGKFNLDAIDELKREIAEAIKSNGVAKKSGRNFKAKLRSLMKSEPRISAKDKNNSNRVERNVSFNLTKKVNNVPEPEDAINCKLGQIQTLQFNDFMQCNQNVELNVTKACKERAKMELTSIIQKNKAFIDELKEVQQR